MNTNAQSAFAIRRKKQMAAICRQCGKTIDGEEMAFCPYCGAKLETPAEVPSAPADREAEKWIQKAKNVPSYPERRKILLKGLEACREIDCGDPVPARIGTV